MSPRVEHIIQDGVEHKKCCRCQTYRPLDNYNNSKQTWDKLRPECKPCLGEKRASNKEKMTEYNKQYWEKTKDVQKEKNKIWRENNKEHIKEKMKEWLENNKEHKRQKDKEYREANWERKKETHRIWMKNDYQDMKTNPDRAEEYKMYKLKSNVARRIREILKQEKSMCTMKYVGCSLEELREHLESQFEEGMTWDNYGKYNINDEKSGWHIDHIIPCNSFNFQDKTEVDACFYYLNLQPLWGKENIQKSDNYDVKEKEDYIIQYKIRKDLNNLIEKAFI